MDSFNAFWAGSASASTASAQRLDDGLGRDLSLTETLASLGMSHVPATHGQHLILDASGDHLFTGSAVQTWRWLKNTGRIPQEAQ